MKKTAKKLFSLILTMAFLLALLPGAVQAADSLWETQTLDDGTLSITGYRGLAPDIKIPSSIGGVAVTRIGSNAFRNSDFLVSIVIPSSVTTIGYEAFYGCTALVTADLTEGLCELHNRAFGNCALTHIYIPSTLTTLHAANAGDAPFSGCSSLDAVTFAPGITELPYSLLRGCTGLTSIDIPNTVTTIGDYAFANCTGLASVRIPSSVETVGSSAFAGCTALAELNLPNSVTSVGSGAFQDCTSLTTLSVPGSVESIGYTAFKGCTGLTSVRLSEGLVTLGAQAFRDCTGLTGIYIPSTPKNVSASNNGDGIFNGCTALKSVSFSPELTAIPYSLLRGCPGVTSLTIPDTIEKIGSYAFAGCTSLKTVRISSTVTTIPSSAFAGCTALAELSIPNGVTSIGSGAFQGCKSLTKLSVPGCVTLIDGAAFADCAALTTVTLSEGLRSMGTAVFKGCTALKSINIPASLTSIGASNAEDGSFRNCPALKTLTLSPEAAQIPKNLLRGCQSVTYLNIPATVTTIGDYAFNSCPGLTDIYYGAGETSWAAITVKSGNTGLDGVTIHYNTLFPPTVTANKTSAAVGSAITWTAAASGGSGTLQYYFILYKDGAKLKTRSYSTKNTYSYTPTEPGTYRVRVYVKDAADTKVNKLSSGVTVTAAAPLTLSSIKADKTSASAGEKITWTAAASGGSGSLQYYFILYKDGTKLKTRAYSTTQIFSYTPTEAGTYKVRVYVKDANDTKLNKLSTAVTVTPAGPSISSVKAGVTSAYAGEKITWTAAVSGGSGTLQYYFNLYKDGVRIKTRAYSTANTFSYTPTEAGTYKVRVYVKDAAENKVNKLSAAVTVTLGPPAIISIKAGKTTAAAGEKITWTAAAVGSEQPLQYYFILYKDGVKIKTRAYSTTNTFSYTPTEAGSYKVRVYVKDAADNKVNKLSTAVTVTG